MQRETRHFAAANGYTGFRSYFDEIFPPQAFDRLYILKGGPGTGKSTLLRKIAERGRELGADVERIHCSSDPASLDGVILGKGKKRIGALDGTAPHERDARIPGAIDVLVPLGEYWDEERLYHERDAIVGWNAKKKDAYRKAYQNLYYSSVFNHNFAAEIKRSFDKKKAKDLFSNWVQDENERKKSPFVRLFSGFCKDGFVVLPTGDAYEKEILIGGDRSVSSVFLSTFEAYLSANAIPYSRYPSPLSDDMCDGLLIDDRLLVRHSDAGEDFSAEDYLPSGFKDNFFSEIRERERYMNEAKKAFSAATEAHFALEAIYSSAMDFDALSDASEKLLAEIERNLTNS